MRISRFLTFVMVFMFFLSLFSVRLYASEVPSNEESEFTFSSNDDGTCVLCYANDDITGSVVVPSISPNGDLVTKIDEYAFAGCNSITSINIPSTVTEIGYGAFAGNQNLTIICNPGSDACAFAIENDISYILEGEVIQTPAQYYFESIGGGECAIYIENQDEVSGSLSIPQYSSSGDLVTEIGNYAFCYCKKITEIIIPEGVNKISYGAFDYCLSLESITIPTSVTEIDDYAFCYCKSLTSINIPSTVTEIGYGAFDENQNLTIICNPGSDACAFAIENNLSYILEGEVIQTPAQYYFESIGDGECAIYIENQDEVSGSLSIPQYSSSGDLVTEIGSWAFWNCKKITEIIIPEGVKKIGYCAFDYCLSLESITIPSTLTEIDDYAFENCLSLESITIPSTVTEIGNYAFYNCKKITEITIFDGVKKIGYGAFYNCESLKSINIPKSLQNIGSQAFGGSTPLESLSIAEGSCVYLVDSCLIDKENKILLKGNENSIIPTDGSVTKIDEYAFAGCNSLTSINIPSIVTEIGYGAFDGNQNLTIICNPGSDACAFAIENNISYILEGEVIQTPAQYYFESIGDGECAVYIENRDEVSGSLSIPQYSSSGDLVSEIGYGAFGNCKKITEIIIPEGVKKIGYGAFDYCLSLESITIPTSVTEIESCAFSNCKSLKSISISNGVENIGDYAFSSCNSLTSIIILDGVKKIGYGAFEYCLSLESITIPSTVTEIESCAFSNCKSLKSINIPSGVSKICDYTFYGCDSLTSITISGSVTDIADNSLPISATVFCGKNSPAEKYAIQNNLSYEYTEEIVTDTVNPTAIINTIYDENIYYDSSIFREVGINLSDNLNVSSYRLEYKKEGNSEFTLISEGVISSVTSNKQTNFLIDLSDLEDGNYQFRLTVYDYAGNIGYSELYSFSFDITPPENVKNLLATIESKSITLTWDKENLEPDFDYYQVYRSENEQDYYTLLDETYENKYEDTNIQLDVTYYYYVCSIDKCGNKSKDPLIITAQYQDDLAPTITISCQSIYKEGEYYWKEYSKFTEGSSLYLDVNITDNHYLNRYIVEVSTDGGTTYSKYGEYTNCCYYKFGYSETIMVDFSTFSDGNLFLRAAAYDNAQNVGYSNTVTFYVDYTPPENIKDPYIYATQEYIAIMWSKDVKEDDFKTFYIFRSTAEDGPYTVIDHIETIGYYDTNVEPDITYYYYVVCVDKHENINNDYCILSASLQTDTEIPKLKETVLVNGATSCGKLDVDASITDNYMLSKVVVEYRKEGDADYQTLTEKDIHGTFYNYYETIDLREFTEGTYYFRYKIKDANGNLTTTEDYSCTIIPYSTPVSPTTLTSKRGTFSITLTWDYTGDDSLLKGFEIHRFAKDTEKCEVFRVNANARSYTDYAEEGLYEYYVVAVGIFDETASSITIEEMSSIEDDINPYAFLKTDKNLYAIDWDVSFDISECSDNDQIAKYFIDFGDGNTCTIDYNIRTLSHSYEDIDTYLVTLTVFDRAGNQNSFQVEVKVIDPDASQNYSIVSFTAIDEESGDAISNALIELYNEENGETITINTDEAGIASCIVETGTYSASICNHDGKSSLNNAFSIEDEDNDVHIRMIMKRDNYLKGSIVSKEMTADEILDAGIDTEDPANRYVYQYNATFKYDPVYEDNFEFTYYKNADGTLIKGKNESWQLSSSGYGYSGYNCYVTMLNNGDNTDQNLYFLVVSGEAGCLKEMFKVELLLLNTSEEDWIENCQASLILPNGLSLASMSSGSKQSATVTIESDSGQDGKINPNGQGRAVWYVRGDNPGDYNISAVVEGTYYPEPAEQFSKTFVTESPLNVRDMSNALSLSLEGVPTYVEAGKTVTIKLKATNMLDVALNFVTLKIECEGQFGDVLCPVQTNELEYPIKSLASGGSCTIDIDFTFPQSGNIKAYRLSESIFWNGNNVPAEIFYQEKPDDQGELILEIDAWKDFNYETQEWSNPITIFDYALGSFSWQIDEDNDFMRTNYDKVYLKVSVEHAGLDSMSAISTSLVITIKAPDGFSFDRDVIKSEKEIEVTDLYIGEKELICVLLYPIYSLKYVDGEELNIEAKIVSDIYEEIDKTINFATIKKVLNEGEIVLADSPVRYDAKIDFSWFTANSKSFNIELARLGIAFCSLSYCDDNDINKTYQNLGFGWVMNANYQGSVNEIDYSFAAKRFILNEQIYTLIIIPMRGTPLDLNEWIGNLEWLPWEEDHVGFRNATDNLEQAMISYLAIFEDYSAGEKKMFATGHSRGAAVANLFAADIDNGWLNNMINATDLYTYTFATPNTSKLASQNSKYNNIFNIIDYNDIVPCVPPRACGFHKYGTTYCFSASKFHYSPQLISNVIQTYGIYTNGDDYNPLTESDRIEILMSLMSNLTSLKSDLRIVLMEIGITIAEISLKYLDKILCTHSWMNYSAWMENISYSDLKIMEMDDRFSFKIVEVKCPVDIEVYNSSGELVGKTIDGIVQQNLNGVTIVVEGEHKIILCSSDDSYQVKAIGTGNGTMSITVLEYDFNQVERVINFNDIVVENNKQYLLNVDSQVDDSLPNYLIKNEDESLILPSEILEGDNVDNISVTIKIVGEGQTTGQGNYSKGEIVLLEAISNSTSFLGWYEGNNLLSKEISYCFICDKDTEIEARFFEYESNQNQIDDDNNIPNLLNDKWLITTLCLVIFSTIAITFIVIKVKSKRT